MVWIKMSAGMDPIDFNDNTEADRIGSRIRKIRMELGLSQTELGEMVALTADRIQKYENGARKPKPEMLKKIADALGVSTLALADPVVLNYIGAMYAFFEMEEAYDLKVIDENGRLKLIFGDGRIGNTMNKYLSEWEEEKARVDKELEAASSEAEKQAIKKDYDFWKWSYPDALVDQSTKAQKKARIQERIEQLQQALSELEEDK